LNKATLSGAVFLMEKRRRDGMSGVDAKARIKEAIISARVIRADGSIEDLGIIARTKQEPEKLSIKRLAKLIKGGNR